MSNKILTCLAPVVTGNTNMVIYGLRLDNVPPPDFTRPALQLFVRPDPVIDKLITQSIVNDSNSTKVVEIEVKHYMTKL